MEITGKGPYVNLEAYFQKVKDKEKIGDSSGQVTKEGHANDKVVISSKGKEVQEAKEVLKSIPDVREDKVLRIKKGGL